MPLFFIFLPTSHSETPISVMKGHQDRICRVAFHPSGNYVASASFDTTWRLWDINTSKEILLQEGHSREVYAVEFQDDGALAASAYAAPSPFMYPTFMIVPSGLDAIGRVWDLRTGRTAMVLDGHVEGILTMAFSPNGYTPIGVLSPQLGVDVPTGTKSRPAGPTTRSEYGTCAR